MSKMQQVERSFRALVGVCEDGAGSRRGVYVIDSNDTVRFHAFFAIAEGLSEGAERFCMDFLRKNVEPYLDLYKRTEISRPGAFIKNLLQELNKEMVSNGLVDSGDASYSMAVVLVRGDHLYIGRVNSIPVYYLKERKFRQVMGSGKGKGQEKIQVVGTTVADGDMMVLGTKNVLKNMTELELKSILMSDSDLSMVCSRINLQANKYEETQDPRLIALRFVKNAEESQSIFSRRNLAIMGSLAMLVLVAFLWGEIVRYMKSGPMSFIMNKDGNVVRKVIEKVSMPRASSFNLELVYDGLAVPYDLTIGSDGVIYIVDDKEEGVVRYNPATGEKDIIGESAKLIFPTGIDLMNDYLFVVDFSYQRHKVFILGKDGNRVGIIPDERSANMISLNNPKALEAVEADKSVYICDRGNNRVIKFDNEGTYQKTIKMPANFKEPNGIAITEGGIIYLTLKMSGQVGTISGTTVNEFTIFEETAGNERKKINLAKPSGIAVDRKGNVYVADTGNQRVVVADQMGKLLAFIDDEKVEEFKSYYPMSVKLDPKGEYIYLVAGNRYSYDVTSRNQCNGKIWKFKI